MDNNLPSLPSEEVESQSLTLRRKSAGRPQVKSDTSRPTKIGNATRVIYPGLGKVNIVIH